MAAADREIEKATNDRAAASADLSQEGISWQERAHLLQSFNTANNKYWEAHTAKRKLNDRHEERRKGLAA
eukprot:10488192-Heterocapsa_arctica.AAC.1